MSLENAPIPKIEKVKVSELPPDKRELLTKLELKTMDMYEKRAEMFYFYKNIRDALPVITKEVELKSGKKQKRKAKPNVSDLISWKENDEMEAKLFGPMREKLEKEGMDEDEIEMELIDLNENMENLFNLHQQATSGQPPQLLEAQYYENRIKGYGLGASKLGRLEAKVKKAKRMEELARNNPKFRSNPQTLRKFTSEYEKAVNEENEFIKDNPEAFLYTAYKQIKEMKDVFDENGMIVETPHVKENMARILGIVREQERPVFIHGELGSGKTEIARYLCKKELSKEFIDEWEKENSKPQKPAYDREKYKSFEKYLNSKEYRKWQNAHAEWKAKRELAIEPIIISGHKGITIEEVLGGRSIERKDMDVSPEEQTEIIENAVANFFMEKELDDEIGGLLDNIVTTSESILRSESSPMFSTKIKEEFEHTNKVFRVVREGHKDSQSKNIERQLRKAYEERFKNPVEVLPYLGKFYEAMKQGKPLIIDEMNAIPHHVLIVLNDLLNKKPGDVIIPQIPGLEKFTVKKGFCVIATGNWRPENGFFVGREKLDPAFVSRFGLVSYDYLPQERDYLNFEDKMEKITADQSKVLLASETFKMLLVRLLDSSLGANLPEGSVFKKIFNLARAAKTIQNIQSGTFNTAVKVNGRDVVPKDYLKENVLSLRHLIPIVEKWQADGFTRDLDDYIFLDYVERSKARPDEMMLIYRILKDHCNFFQEAEWPDDETQVVNFNMVKKMYGVNELTGKEKPIASANLTPLKYYAPTKIIRYLFGEIPERKVVAPQDLEEQIEEVKNEEEMAMEMEILSLINGIGSTVKGVKSSQAFGKFTPGTKQVFE